MSDTEQNGQKKKKSRKGRKAVTAVILLALLGGGGFGLGTGLGLFPGSENAVTSDATSASSDAATAQSVQEDLQTQAGDSASGADDAQSGADESGSMVVIRVGEAEISADGQVFTGVDDLREYIMSVNTDESVYVLQDDYAIESAYASVKALLDDLNVTYSEEKVK